MIIDQIWVEENIDEIMNVFIQMNPQYKSKDNGSRAHKSRHKKNMLENMDTSIYRPIYHIARFTKVKELKLRKIISEQNEEIKQLEKCNHANAESFQDYKEKSRKLESDNSTLKKYNERLKKRIEELEIENRELKKRIQELESKNLE